MISKSVAGYPALVEAAAMLAAVAVASSNLTIASLASKFTLTDDTPGTDAIAFFTVIGQSAQVMCLIENRPLRSVAYATETVNAVMNMAKIIRIALSEKRKEIDGKRGTGEKYTNP